MKLYESIYTTMEDLRQDIIDEYEGLKIKATGDFERKMVVTKKGKKVILSLPYYAKFITILNKNQPGYPPGSSPSIDSIVKWFKAKGLKIRDVFGKFRKKDERSIRQVAVAITKKIEREGTDIYQGKRDAIDIDKLIEDRFDHAMKELSDRILDDFR